MLDRTVAPAFRPIDHISIKEAKEYPIGPSTTLYCIQSGTQPVIKLEVIFKAGKWYESKAGQALFTGKMLREGAGQHNAFSISDIFETFGAHLEIVPTLDYIAITIYSMEAYFSQLLPVVLSMVKEPVFPEKELQVLKNIQVQSLRVNNKKNNFVASRKLRESLFGPLHPYGHILNESEIQEINRYDLINYFNESIRDKPLTLISSGLLTDPTIQLLVDSFKPSEEGPALAESGNEIQKTHPNVLINKEESSQSSIRLGQHSIPMRHPDYPGLLIVNEILGGYFGSRLMKNIREEKGLTYGIYSSLSSLRNATFFSIAADVKKEFRDLAFVEIKSEIRKLQSELIGIPELDTVRNYMLGQIQASVNTPFALATKFKNIHFNGLDYSYYDNLIETIQTIDPDRIMELSNKYLDPDKMVEICVG